MFYYNTYIKPLFATDSGCVFNLKIKSKRKWKNYEML